MKKIVGLCLLLSGFFPFSYCNGQPASAGSANPYAVCTFECAGIYWKVPEYGNCRTRYKEVNGKLWKEGPELVYDSRDGEYRGSIVNLIPDRNYLVELANSTSKTQLMFNTRKDNFPVGKVTYLSSDETDKTIVITESGTSDAYHLVTVPVNGKTILNLKNIADNGIEIDADYVIVRGPEIRNARIHGIRINKNRHDIVIEQCHMIFWGRMGGPETYGNLEGDYDSGIYADEETWNITIQRNLIEDPRGASNDWETGHPGGPQGISIFQSKGGNVIRYNDIVTTEDHGFNDGIGGGENFSFEGNMNRDSDIYGNLIMGVWDDAIESEGANMNVRIWGNYGALFFNGIATASTSKGPLYVFRNVLGKSRTGHRNSKGGAFIKTGEREPFAGGRRFIYHNTAMQPDGVTDAFTGHVNPNCVSRNNIFDLPGRLATNLEKEPASDYDYDYFSGILRGTAQEKHGIKFGTTPSGTRLYVDSYKLEFYPRVTINSIKWGQELYEFGEKKVNLTDPVIWMKSPLIDGGIVIKGFNDDFVGAAPDLGAFEVGSPPLEFGRRAYLKYDQGWCPWEKF